MRANMTRTTLLALALALLMATGPASSQTIRYYHTDLTGSVVAVTDEQGNVVERRQYEPYGLPQSPIPDGPGYTGHDMDGETGLIYMQQRYYDPTVGRFLSPDPMAVDTNTAWNFNRYNYAANNPYRYTDPDGREIRLQWHMVEVGIATGKFHTLLTITPDNQGRYSSDDRFKNVGEDGRRYATIGAGPTSNLKLRSDVNRGLDREQHGGGIIVDVPEGYANEDTYIDALFQLDSQYADDSNYDFFPSATSEGYNSNSYTSGLLNASGADAPTPHVDAPGYDKPLPTEEFERR